MHRCRRHPVRCPLEHAGYRVRHLDLRDRSTPTVSSPPTGDSRLPPWPGPDLERDLDLGSPVAELHDVARTQVDDTGDAVAVQERSVSAPNVHDLEPHPTVIAWDDPRVVPPDRGIRLGETDSRGWRAAEDQLTVRAERDDVNFGRPRTTEVSEDEADHTFQCAKHQTEGSR